MSTRQIIGTALVGAIGATPNDQLKIDETVARLCGTGTWSSAECINHQTATTGVRP